jgi:DNA-binding MarR family transcriptional regulator
MDDSKPIPLEHNLQLLETIEENPQVTQADLAAQLGVAVGTVNWYLKRLISKGYVKIRRMQRKRLLYLITPRGIAEKSRLGVQYMRASLRVYRETREQAIQLLNQARRAGYDQVVIEGDADLAEICRLTCLEQDVKVAKAFSGAALPALEIDGARIRLVLPQKN